MLSLSSCPPLMRLSGSRGISRLCTSTAYLASSTSPLECRTWRKRPCHCCLFERCRCRPVMPDLPCFGPEPSTSQSKKSDVPAHGRGPDVLVHLQGQTKEKGGDDTSCTCMCPVVEVPPLLSLGVSALCFSIFLLLLLPLITTATLRARPSTAS